MVVREVSSAAEDTSAISGEMGIQRETFTYYITMMAFVTSQLLFFAACDLIRPHMGVNYGTIANNHPAPAEVISLFKRNRIQEVRIYNPNPVILNALRSMDIGVTIGVRNEDIPNIARSPIVANAWVKTNILPYKGNFTVPFVLVGNEVIPGPYAADVASAIRNIRNSLLFIGIYSKVSTSIPFNLQASYPPSAGVFPANIGEILKDVTHVLRETQSPLFVSIYPYYAYASDPNHVSFEYATFTTNRPVIDGPLRYFSLLDAQIDACYAALSKIGAGDIAVAVAETGWPTSGNEPSTSLANAQAYNSNLIKRVMSGKGTPARPAVRLDVWIFDAIDENLKPPGIEQHWGIFLPNMEHKYPLAF